MCLYFKVLPSHCNGVPSIRAPHDFAKQLCNDIITHRVRVFDDKFIFKSNRWPHVIILVYHSSDPMKNTTDTIIPAKLYATAASEVSRQVEEELLVEDPEQELAELAIANATNRPIPAARPEQHK